MSIKFYKPTTNARRNMSVTDYSELSKVAPERSLLVSLKKNSGRNSYGRITVRHRGGGVRTKYRIIDFKRDKFDVPATVKSIEYDPNRSAFIALLQYEDGEKRYILQPVGLKVGDTVVAGTGADIKPGNALPLTNIPVGTVVHNVELYPGRGGQLARAAGNSAQLMAKEGGYALLRLRFCHEPERPPARRRRGQISHRKTRPRNTLGQACSRLQDKKDKEIVRQAYHKAS